MLWVVVSDPVCEVTICKVSVDSVPICELGDVEEVEGVLLSSDEDESSFVAKRVAEETASSSAEAVISVIWVVLVLDVELVRAIWSFIIEVW